MVVYLAGSISKDQEGFCRLWRKKVEKTLNDNYTCINPIRGKCLDSSYTLQEIFLADLLYVTNSDIIIAEFLREDYNYIGTSMELMFAHLQDKEILVVTDVDKIKENYFMRAVSGGNYFDSFSQVVQYLNSIGGGINERG